LNFEINDENIDFEEETFNLLLQLRSKSEAQLDYALINIKGIPSTFLVQKA